ncbi:MAG: aminoglycoside phosphotransferase family protein [Betaproteobacteria bacterium]|jgi:aminoglycoside phosphotransferase (APT) family kinase protein|nr:aminoglycoside phosphotransferase family protein [Burkholderiaceae bacterium]
MDPDQPHIDSALVRHLVTTQFPRWADLSVAPVENGGWCNRVFHLGDEMIVRLPRHRAYAEQTAKEYQWLPRLAPLLPLPIPEPLAIGEPAGDYPWQWSVYRWIEGDPALPERITNMTTFATDLGSFLAAMQSLDTMSGPPPGPHNFYRGGSLATYDSQTRQAIAALEGKVDTDAAMEVWETALSATWADAPVWIHGDVSVGNLLVRNGRLRAVIDFGNLAVGDPACDLAVTWIVFNGESRESFRAKLPLDAGTWARGRGWVLWKALIVAAGFTRGNAFADSDSRPWRIIEQVLADHRRTLV